MKTETLTLRDGTEFEAMWVPMPPSLRDYNELKEAGYQTDHFHVDTSGNDYWDYSVWFCKENDWEIAQQWVKEDMYL